MTVRISRSVLARIVAQAEASGDEICGLLFGRPDAILDAQPAPNVAADPARAFEIDPAILIQAYRAARHGGPRPIGHYHSHPTGDPAPSARDAAAAPGDGALWLIVGVTGARLWRNDAPHRFVPMAMTHDM